MCYMLGIMLEYHRYHRDAVLRIFADNHLVDEILLSKDIRLRPVNISDNSIKKYPLPTNLSRIEYCTEKLFLFEIDESKLNDQITIEVKNDQNNHTNGFMTEFSYIKFHKIFIIPKCLTNAKKWRDIMRLSADNFVNLINHYPPVVTYDDIVIKHSSNAWTKGIFLRRKIGGSFTIDIVLTKKHRLIHLGKLLPGKVNIDNNVGVILWAFKQLNIST